MRVLQKDQAESLCRQCPHALFLQMIRSREPQHFESLRAHADFNSNRGNPTFSKDPTALRSALNLGQGLLTECNLSANGIRDMMRRMLKSLGYSLQSNRKMREGVQHPDRDGQFRQIHERVQARKRRGEPAISVDTKKEVLGNLKNPGQTWRPQGDPVPVKTHDFPDPKLGKAVPDGVYDIHDNSAGVSVGVSHDTAEFAVEAIRRWWTKLGRPRYLQAKRIVVTADSGGSNSSRSRLWKVELQRWADETGLIVEVCHDPPGTSKWNKIEHRLFCHITKNWRGVPLATLDVVVQSIAATTTKTGLEVHAWLDADEYEKGRVVSDDELDDCQIVR